MNLSNRFCFYHRLLFKCVVIFTQMLGCVAYVHELIGPYQRILLGWGLLLIILELFRGYKPWKNRSVVFFCLFLVSYAASIAFAGSEYLTENIKAFLYMIMMFFVFYGIDTTDEEQRRIEYTVLGKAVIFTVLILAVVGLVYSFKNVKWYYFTEKREMGFLGWYKDRFSGVLNPNTGGALYSVSIIISVLCLLKKGSCRVLRSILYILNIIFMCFLLLLTYSRTSMIALAGALVLGVFCMLPNYSKTVAKLRPVAGFAVRFGAAAVLAAILVFGMKSARSVCMDIYDTAKTFIKEPVKSSESTKVVSNDNPLTLITDADTNSSDEEEDDSIREKMNELFSDRIFIWEAGLRIINDSPVLGVSNEAVSDLLSEDIGYKVWHAHSIYLTVLVASGAVGAIILAAFSINNGLYLLRRRRQVCRGAGTGLTAAILLVVFFLIKELTETTILFRFSFFSSFFWMVMGAIRSEVICMKEDKCTVSEAQIEDTLKGDGIDAKSPDDGACASAKEGSFLTKLKEWKGAGFSLCYFVLAALSHTGYISRTWIISALVALVLAWATVRIIMTFREVVRSEAKVELILFGAFLVSYAISSFLTRSYGVTENLKAAVWIVLCLFLVYPSGIVSRMSERKPGKRPAYFYMIYAIMIYTTVMALIGLVMWFTGYSKFVTASDIYGIMYGRLWGLYGDPNYGSSLSAASISIALVLLAQGKEKKWVKICYVVHILVLYLFIIGAYSRGTQIVMYVIFGLFFIYYCYKQKKLMLRLATFAALVFMCFMPLLVRGAYNKYVNSYNEMIEEMRQEAIEAGIDPDTLGIGAELSEVERDSVFGEGGTGIRMQIWGDGVTLIKMNPVFGISYRNIVPYAEKHFPSSVLIDGVLTLHNMVLDVGVSQGIVGLILLFVTAATILYKLISLWRVSSKEERDEQVLFMLPILTIIGGAMFISDIFYINSPSTVVFWYLLGQLMGIYYEKKATTGMKKIAPVPDIANV